MYLLEFIMCVKKKGPIIFVALISHYTPNLMSCNGASYKSRELSADQFVYVALSVYMNV
jgi:hypothetical protein